jgi:hypothetical protein
MATGPLFSQGTDGTLAIDTLLTQEANRIGPDIHKRTLHVSPWLDLIKKTTFPEGMGSTLGTLIYDRALPTTDQAGSSLGVSWRDIGLDPQTAKTVTNTRDQMFIGATDTNVGPQTGKSFIQFSREFKQYAMKRAVVESPRLNVEDLRYAAFRTEQLRAIMDAMTEATRYTLEERARDEYDRLCGNIVICKATANTTTIKATNDAGNVAKEGTQSWDLVVADPTANISNKILDSLYFRLVRGGAGTNAYGRENARPVFAAVMSSEASYKLITETNFRDDYRYNSSKVGDLIAPLGVERSHRGFYHLIDDLAPRYVADTDTDATGTDTDTGKLNRVYPYKALSGVISINTEYEDADFEALYLLNQDVMESQVPSPNVSAPGVSFDPVDYKGKFNWLNIQDEVINPDKTIGFFRGVIATASKPLKTEFGYVVIFARKLAALAA